MTIATDDREAVETGLAAAIAESGAALIRVDRVGADLDVA